MVEKFPCVPFSLTHVCAAAIMLTVLPSSPTSVSTAELSAPVISSSPYTLLRPEMHSNLTLNCSVTGNPKPKVTWYFKNNNFTDGILYPNGSIAITNMLMAHSGKWHCEAENSQGKAISGPIGMRVKVPPQVTRMSVKPSNRVAKGEVVTIQCALYGAMPISGKWYKNGKRLVRDWKNFKIRGHQQSIKIYLQRSATIRCEMSNFYGMAHKETEILVFDKGALVGPPTTPTAVPTTTRPPIICQPYTGIVCLDWLSPGHRWAYETSVDSPSSAAGREAEMTRIFAALDGATRLKDSSITPMCSRGMKALLCGRAFPVCPGSSPTLRDKRRPGPVCREHCEAVQRLFCPRISSSIVWSALRNMDLPSKTLQRYLDRDTPLCKGLPPAVPPQVAGAEISAKPSTTSHCTMVDFEAEWRRPDAETQRAKNRCFVNRGQLYNGPEHQARLSPDSDKLLDCARWNDTRVASSLLRKGYSVVAFPSLRTAGNSCRNPAGLQERPFCVPDNPTVREQSLLVSCNLLSCLEYHEIQQQGQRDEVNILGITIDKQRLTLAIAILIIIFVFLIFLISYCIFCLCISRPAQKGHRDHEHGGPDNVSFLGMGSSLGASIASEYDPSDAKSLLTPNQDYHGKALAEFISPQLQKLEYPRTDIRDITEIGQGAFGEVYLVEASKLDVPDKRVAMKVLKNDAAPDMQIQFLREATLLADLSHKNIVKLLGISLVYKPFCMLMEYMSHGDLNSFLRRYGPHESGRHVTRDPLTAAVYRRPGLSNGHVYCNGSDIYIQMLPQPSLKLDRIRLCRMAVDISEGMIYLSHLNYVHRDLASRNCLLDSNFTVKIADFGLCRYVRRGEDFIDDDHGAMPIRWMPLESILEKRFNLDTDVWSFGVLMWELFSFAAQPYHGKTHDEVIEFLQKGSYLDKPAAAPDNVYRLMLRCWSRQRRERPAFAWLMRQLSELLRRWTENERET